MISIEGYTDIVRIGQGGLGDVYRATRASTGGVVAIKVLRDISDESVAWHRTRRELTALVALAGHANVIQLIELLELEQGPALVMEYAPGGSVADLMKRRDATLSVGETVLVGRHTSAALVAAHSLGIVHRDIKPQNLLIDAYGQVKLCDFGVAALTRSDDFQARTSALSMRYASPEDLDNEVDVGPASDVYSLGATLLHLARGAPPTLKERLAPWHPPGADDADAASLDAVIASCLHPEPASRPSAAVVLDELDRLGWAVDERQRALAFDPPPADDQINSEDLPTDPRPSVAPPGAPAVTPVESGTSRLSDPAGLPEVHDDPTVQRPWPTATEHTDDTVHVPSRRPPPRPIVPSRRRRWMPWLLVGVLAVLIAVPAIVLWPSDDDAPVDSVQPGSSVASPATDPPPTGTSPPPEVDVALVVRPADVGDVTDDGVVWPFGPVGECLVRVAGQVELQVVECDEPHDMQRLLVAELDGERWPAGAPFVTAEPRTIVREACTAAFLEFTGIPITDSVLEAPFTLPSEATWAEGDRGYQCLLFTPGRRIVGDAARTSG